MSKDSVIIEHPHPQVTSVTLSDGHRVFVGREVELTDARKKLLKEEFPEAKSLTPAQWAKENGSEGGSTGAGETAPPSGSSGNQPNTSGGGAA